MPTRASKDFVQPMRYVARVGMRRVARRNTCPRARLWYVVEIAWVGACVSMAPDLNTAPDQISLRETCNSADAEQL